MSPSATRMDPYKNFKFRIMWDGEYIAGASLTPPRAIQRGRSRRAGQPATSSTSQSFSRVS